MSLRVVHFEETGEQREVQRPCKRCSTTEADVLSGYIIVSPTGVAHHSHFDKSGTTECGLDATGDEWWWPL